MAISKPIASEHDLNDQDTSLEVGKIILQFLIKSTLGTDAPSNAYAYAYSFDELAYRKDEHKSAESTD
jgi:hypothetical protein